MRRLFSNQRGGSDLSSAALTPMVDLFTILVIAVLRASSPEPPIESIEDGFQLPISKSETSSQQSASLEIGTDGIALNGIRIASTLYWSKQDAILIQDLKAALLLSTPDRIQIKAHADTPWNVVNKALFTTQQAGIKDVEIIALSASSL